MARDRICMLLQLNDHLCLELWGIEPVIGTGLGASEGGSAVTAHAEHLAETFLLRQYLLLIVVDFFLVFYLLLFRYHAHACPDSTTDLLC